MPAEAPRGRIRSWIPPLLLLLGTLVVFAATATRSVACVDVHAANLAGWHLVEAGHPWMEDFDLSTVPEDPTGQHYFIAEAANGHEVVFRSPGVVALATVAHAIGRTASPELVPSSLLAAALGAVAVTLMFIGLTPRLGRRTAALAALAFAFATPVWSNAANGLWPHTLTVLGIAGMAWAASRDRWWLVGAFGGLAFWGRAHSALITAALGLGVALLRRRPSVAMRVGLVGAAALALAAVWTRWMYGSWSPLGGYSASTSLSIATASEAPDGGTKLANQLGLWVSADRGILVWTPVLLLLLPALARSWRDLPDWSRSLLVGGLLYTFVQGFVNVFDGGDAFYGYRLGLELLACATPAFALASPAMGRVARRLVGPVLALQLAAISLGSVVETIFIPREDAWTRNAFVSALAEKPVLVVWPLLFLVAGALAERMWRRDSTTQTRTTSTVSEPAVR